MTELLITGPPAVDAHSGLPRRQLAAATIGGIVESFDWSVYVVFAAFFTADLFGSDSLGATIVAYGGFAVGFLARPIGSLLFGRVSDSRGRRFNLLLCMSIISAASIAIALLPSAATIGVWSAVALVALRIVQGLAYGGEGPTIAAYVAETAPPRHRFLFSAISYGGIMFGSMLVFLTVAVLNATIGAEALREGGWRWGFVAGGLLGVLALWIRAYAPESAEFEGARSEGRTGRPSLAVVFREHRQAALTIFLLTLGGTVTYYFALVYLPKYAALAGVAETASATSFMTVVLIVVLVAMLVVGVLADRFGVLTIMRITFAFNAIGVLPVTFAMVHGVIAFEIAALVLGLGAAGFAALGSVLCALLMPTGVRAVGAGLVSTVTVTVFGGTFPMVAEVLQAVDLSWVVPVYVFIAMLALLAGSFTVTKVALFTQTFEKEPVHVHS
ncbi:MFS transporter [Nocardia uniformis]|uniref:MFS transporter n=1 Tax=Nocardia uniformis TaxID=53432 RepID=A0A849BRN7_9NOCA|nr:MFS transporter [Nocardia uniformis]NNH69283.1 MFS transporter [Nocardia uniformis]